MEKLNHKDQFAKKPVLQFQLQSLGESVKSQAWLGMQVPSRHQLHEVCATSPDDNNDKGGGSYVPPQNPLLGASSIPFLSVSKLSVQETLTLCKITLNTFFVFI